MAADSNALISRTSYINGYGTGWFHNDEIVNDYIQNQSSYNLSYYIAAPCIHITFGSWHTGPDSTQANMTVYKYNGRTFERYGRVDINLNISDSSDWRYKYFGHNVGSSYDITDESDVNLWKIECNWFAGQWIFVSTRCGMYLNIACSGIGTVPNNSTYNYLWRQNSKLHACECNYWPTSSFSSDTDFINQKKPEAYSGQPISAATGYMAYSNQQGD